METMYKLGSVAALEKLGAGPGALGRAWEALGAGGQASAKRLALGGTLGAGTGAVIGGEGNRGTGALLGGALGAVGAQGVGKAMQASAARRVGQAGIEGLAGVPKAQQLRAMEAMRAGGNMGGHAGAEMARIRGSMFPTLDSTSAAHIRRVGQDFRVPRGQVPDLVGMV